MPTEAESAFHPMHDSFDEISPGETLTPAQKFDRDAARRALDRKDILPFPGRDNICTSLGYCCLRDPIATAPMRSDPFVLEATYARGQRAFAVRLIHIYPHGQNE